MNKEQEVISCAGEDGNEDGNGSGDDRIREGSVGVAVHTGWVACSQRVLVQLLVAHSGASSQGASFCKVKLLASLEAPDIQNTSLFSSLWR